MPTAVQHVLKILFLLGGQLTEFSIGNDFGESDYVVQRRSELMRHVGQELAFRTIGDLRRFFCVRQVSLDEFAFLDFLLERLIFFG